MGIRTPVFGVKGRNDWPDYTIAARCSLNLIVHVKINCGGGCLRVNRGPFRLGHGMERCHQLPGDRPRFSAPDRPAIDKNDGRNFCCRSGHKHLVGRIHIIVPEVLFHDSYSQRPSDLYHYGAGDASQVIQGWRSENGPVLHELFYPSRSIGTWFGVELAHIFYYKRDKDYCRLYRQFDRDASDNRYLQGLDL